MTNAERIILLNTALVQVCDAAAKLEAARSNLGAVFNDIGIAHPSRETIATALDRAKMAKIQLNELCERFPR